MRGKTAEEAKLETQIKVFSSLEKNHHGLRFTDLWKDARIHKDTLATVIPRLLRSKVVEKVNRMYRLTDLGIQKSYKILLLRKIEECESELISYEGSSVNAAEEVRDKSTISYSFPAIPVEFTVEELVHRKYLAWWLYQNAGHNKIDPRFLTGELPMEDLVRTLKNKLPEYSQILAFLLDFGKIRDLINEEYVSDILRTLKSSPYMDDVRRLAREEKVLEYLEHKESYTSISKIAEDLVKSPKETEEILDRLVDKSSQQKRFARTLRGGAELRVRLGPGKSFLEKRTVKKLVYYRIIDRSRRSA